MSNIAGEKSIPPINLLNSIEVRPIFRHERSLWDNHMREYHYLGFTSMVGESIRYIAIFQGSLLALLGWSAAALKSRTREQWIGWSPVLKRQRLEFVANNARFLILGEERIPNLASRILSLNLKRLSQDWQRVYGHPIWIVETFVDPRYFLGTCYKAAGWSFLGYSSGYAKRNKKYTQHNNPKMVFVRALYPDARKRLSNPYLTCKCRKGVKAMKLSRKDADELMKRLLQIPEPRMARGIRHQRISILAVAICAIMSNAYNFAAIAEWAKRCTQNMLKRLCCRYNKKTKRYEPPSEPTIRRFLQEVDAESVDKALCGWLQSFSGTDSSIAIDGKTLKGARQSGGKQVHLLSAFLHNGGTVIAQNQVDTKTNEITMVRPLLDQLDIKDMVVTLDAMHTQKETARYLVEEKKADYLFVVKDNQKNLRKDIEDLKMVGFPLSGQNY
jgi:hypothetical protein